MPAVTLQWSPAWKNDIGHSGWIIPAYRDWMYPIREGDLLAHDVLQHISPEQDGSVAKEISALGAAAFTHFLSGGLHHPMYTPEEDMGTSLSSLVIEQFEVNNGRPLDPPPRNRLVPDFDSEFGYIFSHCEASCSGPARSWFRRHERSVRLWFADGFARARRRYGDPGYALMLFQAVSRAADGLIKRSIGFDDYLSASDEVTLRYCIARRSAELIVPPHLEELLL